MDAKETASGCEDKWCRESAIWENADSNRNIIARYDIFDSVFLWRSSTLSTIIKSENEMKDNDIHQVLNILKDVKVTKFSDLIGKTLCKVFIDDEQMRLYITDSQYVMLHHTQDCCESVYIESVVGDVEDLVGSEILMAEEVSYDGSALSEYDESYTWTFYKFATIKGSVDVRWYGSSNGYYSEGVSIDVVDMRS